MADTKKYLDLAGLQSFYNQLKSRYFDKYFGNDEYKLGAEECTIKAYIDAKVEAATPEGFNSLVDDVNSLKSVVGDSESGLIKDVADLKSVDVDQKISDAVSAAKAEILGTGEMAEAYDTLSEISAWISSNGEGVSSLIGTVAGLEEKVGVKGEEGTSSTGLYKEIEDAISGIVIPEFEPFTEEEINSIFNETPSTEEEPNA